MKKNFLYALSAVLIWSTLAPVGKVLLTGIPNMQTLAVGSWLAAAFLVLVNLKSGSIRLAKQYTLQQYGMMAGLGFLGLFLYNALYYYGLTQLSSQEACILNYLWPMMLVLFSCVILREKLTVLKAGAMVCSFAGIVILTLGSGGVPTGGTAAGMIGCVAAAAFYGLFSVLNKKADLDQNISMTVMWFVTAICATVMGLATEEWVVLSAGQWIGMLWMGIVVSAAAYLLWALALKGAQSTAGVANLAYLTPFLSMVISAVFLKEPVRLSAIAALVLIVGGILLQSIMERKHS